jgi:hypothetical protein
MRTYKPYMKINCNFILYKTVVMDTIILLKRIVDKGAVIGRCAKLYLHNNSKADQFIKECAEQCHRKSAKELWGEVLTNDILAYSKKCNVKKKIR